MSIEPDIFVKDLIALYPFLKSLFQRYQLRIVSEENEVIISPYLRLSTLLRHRKIAINDFIVECNFMIKESHSTDEPTKAATVYNCNENLLAIMPCGLRMPFNNTVESYLSACPTNQRFTYYSEGNVNHELTFSIHIDSLEDISELPDVVISSDFNGFFHQKFISSFLNRGYFRALQINNSNSVLHRKQFKDPQGALSMLGVNPLVLVKVQKRGFDESVPASWHDILNEENRKNVVIRGQGDFFCTGVLTYFFQMFGNEGIRALARSVHSGMHPAEMVKHIDSGNEEIPQFYIMPWFFTRKIKKKERVNVVFPREGALGSPIQALIKKDCIEHSVADFLASKNLHQTFADNLFPTLHPEIVCELPEHADIRWLGWDFIYNQDMAELKRNLQVSFMNVFRS